MSPADVAPTQPAGPDADEVASELLAWLPSARRDLPWRRRRDPYAVWVSEMMLQQTQSATVVPYFERWLARFPDVAALAAAPLADVLRAWEGLGYYARARHMHKAAQRMVKQYGGLVPGRREALMSLPGIGRYTAGAILSLAFGQAEPVLDGNVRRVLCRIYDLALPVGPHLDRQLWELAGRLVKAAAQPGDLNEALMELGALVCTPLAPQCTACPAGRFCLARQRGVQAERPLKAPRAATPQYLGVSAVLADEGGRYLLAQRPAAGLLGGLWEFPGERAAVPLARAEEADAPALASILSQILVARLGIHIAVEGAAWLRVRHAYTHFRTTLNVFNATLLAGEPAPLGYADVRWLAPAELTGYALPVTDRKIAVALHGRLAA